MAALPVVSGREAAKAFGRLGWTVARQSPSHIMMVHPNSRMTLSIPDHDEVARGTLRSLIRRAGLTVDEFVAAL